LRWVYLRQTDRFGDMTNLGKPLRADLEAAFINPRLQVENEATSKDGSRKLLFRLHDGLHIETVIIPEKTISPCASPARWDAARDAGSA
jgi:23S rRNA (adenine2503-C2)-methyltransferase